MEDKSEWEADETDQFHNAARAARNSYLDYQNSAGCER